MRIRKAGAQDSVSCAEIHRRARKAMAYLPALHTATEVEAWMRDIVLSHQEVRVAEIDRKIVGYASLAGDLLTNLYVDPDYQGRGIGGALLAHIQTIAPRGFDLRTFEPNKAAIRFYERHGFRTLDITDSSANEEQVPDRLMRWRPAS